jgi:alkylation response protein AidB-like acyl-CoA dehydrogenase
MHFAFTEEQEALRRAARQFLAEYASSKRVRQAMASTLGYDPEVWQLISRDLGWPALIIPEEYGGAGGTSIELAAIMEEAGRALLCAPLFSTVCLATNAILLNGSEAQKRSWLPKIAAGEVIATVAWLDSVKATPTARGFTLNGVKEFVTDGATADLLIVQADLQGDDSLFLVRGDAAGLERKPYSTLDQTRRQASLRFRDVTVSAEDRLSGSLVATLHRAAIALAAEQVGGAERCLEMAVDYAKTRQQFGRPIGSFQAIKHKCAEMAMRVESARSAAYYAAWAATEEPADLHLAQAIAKVYCSETYFHCASENIQIHGGIGFTWEHDAHLYFKRAKSSEILLLPPSEHRRVITRKLVGA